MPPSDPVFLAHVGATLALVGLIWVVQLVLYPQFLEIAAVGGRAGFRAYHESYTRRITWIVGPLIATEGITALLLLSEVPTGASFTEVSIGLLLAAFNFLSTAFVYAPLHGRLGEAYDHDVALRLIRGNWFRTLAWTVRGALVLSWIA
ncbi:MAG: hypothetical protein AAF368_05830 [Planctomycetota bacterium]